MRLSLPLDSHSLSATSTDLCVSTQRSAVRSLCFLSLAIGFLDFDDHVVAAWRPNYNPWFLCAALCLLCIKVAKRKKKRTVPAQPQSPSAQVADVACRSSAHFISVVDYLCHLRMWSIRFDFLGPAWNCLSTFVPAPRNTVVEGCHCGRSQITGRVLDPQEKKAIPQVWSAQIQRQINVQPSWGEEEATAAGKLGWLDMSSGGWWWCASCHMTPNGQFWQSERSYLGTERIMQHSIYPGTNVGMPDTSLCNI